MRPGRPGHAAGARDRVEAPEPGQLPGTRERLDPRQPEHVQRGELRVRSGTGSCRADKMATGTGAVVVHQQQRAPSLSVGAGPRASRRLLNRYQSEGPVMAVWRLRT